MNSQSQIVGVTRETRSEAEHLRFADSGEHADNNFKRYLLNSGGSAIDWATDCNGRVSKALVAWQAYTGQTLKQLGNYGWRKALHRDDWQNTLQTWKRAAASRSAFAVEHRIRHWSGVFQYFSIQGLPVLDERTAAITGWVGTCAEIMERNYSQSPATLTRDMIRLNEELQSRLLQCTADLEASNQQLECLSYCVGHDLRTPLRHIAGFSRILREDFAPEFEEGARPYLDKIMRSTQHAGDLLEGLQQLAHVGRQRLHMHTTELDGIVQDVIEKLSQETKERKIVWQVTGLPQVQCDPVLIRQVFYHLLSNALKFTRPRPAAIIEVSAGERNSVSIRDNGVGFQMKYADRLCGVFQRLHQAEDFEGTGVGLAIVQRILHRHGGRIWYDSEIDGGATFSFIVNPGMEFRGSAPGESGAA